MSVAEFYISKRDNFITFLKEITDEFGAPEFAAIRAQKIAEVQSGTFDDMVTQGIYLRTLMATGGLESYIKTMFATYGVDIKQVPIASLDKINRYLDMFSSI